MELPQTIFNPLQQLKQHTGLSFPFQGSQHINTPLTIQPQHFNPLTIQQLTLLPHLHPRGTLATYPYNHMNHPIVLQH
ncbi:DUF436 family protein, partial [Staphylococcus haemolyticus]|uniref:DUF436 family protein n=1 Tax=Staphylococcus haemolyticus TaxID=1283 RepID=UPI00374F8C66